MKKIKISATTIIIVLVILVVGFYLYEKISLPFPKRPSVSLKRK